MKDVSNDDVLPEDITLPHPLNVAFLAERPELARLWKGPMDAETAEAVAHALAVILAKNKHLRMKLDELRKIMEDGVVGVRRQLGATARKLADFDPDTPPSITEDAP